MEWGFSWERGRTCHFDTSSLPTPAIGGVLGPGFYLPMFEAKNVLIREQGDAGLSALRQGTLPLEGHGLIRTSFRHLIRDGLAT